MQLFGECISNQNAFAVICFDKFSREHTITKRLIRRGVRVNAEDLYAFRFIAER